jgi:hypothetical protein
VSRLSRQFGILNISQPYRPPQLVTGIALLLLSLHFPTSLQVFTIFSCEFCSTACSCTQQTLTVNYRLTSILISCSDVPLLPPRHFNCLPDQTVSGEVWFHPRPANLTHELYVSHCISSSIKHMKPMLKS